MPYKILTYSNPYALDKTAFWAEIKDLPHFCVARTLVNGLVDVMQNSIGGLICQFDDLIKREEIYAPWESNISRKIQQYSYLSKLFATYKEKCKYSDKEEFYSAIKKNQSDFLEALRLFIELDIPASSLHTELALKEQKLFVEVLDNIQQSNVELFKFPDTPDLKTVKATIDALAEKEKHDYIEKFADKSKIDEDKLAWYDAMIKTTKDSELKAIVVHGVHQFTPAQLRLIIDLEKQGLTIYFLFNYQPKFREIYSSWMDIYSNFDVQPITDGNECAAFPPEQQTKSYALARAMGLVCAGNYSPADPTMRICYDKYKDCEYLKFANLTEYAHFVADKVNAAKGKYIASQSSSEGANDRHDSRAVLAKLDEQVYTANRDVHDLLNVYYPEYSKDRHFLSYPIGQFFSGLYRLWNWERGEIKFDLSTIRECINSWPLNLFAPAQLLKVSYVVENLLSEIDTFSKFENDFAKTYLTKYDEITRSAPGSPAYAAKKLSIYDPEKIKREEILGFIDAIRKLNSNAIMLFGQSKTNYIEFGDHFERLEEFIRKHQHELANEAEQALIKELLSRFDGITTTTRNEGAAGTFDDLRKGLYFYLKQKKEDDRVDWIVKNFEQIDGDVLQSRKQHNIHISKIAKGEKDHIEKVYHFACLSDRDMNVRIDDVLPWPLTDQFILKAYAPIDLQFRVYYSALSERGKFLRYALFYGLYFNQCDVRLSYVEEEEEEQTEPYSLLTILGLSAKEQAYTEDEEACSLTQGSTPAKVNIINPSDFQLISMYLCPHRYLMSYVVNKEPVANSDFLYQKVFENALITNTWKRCAGQSKDQVRKYLNRIIIDEAKKLRSCFFFWRDIQISDICSRANNYFTFNIISLGQGSVVEEYKPRHMEIRDVFGAGKYVEDISEYEPHNPYAAYENRTVRNFPRKEYRLHQFKRNAPVQADCERDMRLYLESDTKNKVTVIGKWCTYCPYRNMCLTPYMKQEK